MSKIDKELEDFIGSIFFRLFMCFKFGIKKIKDVLPLFLITFIFPIVSVRIKETILMLTDNEITNYIIWFLLLTIPVIFIYCLGAMSLEKMNKYIKYFKTISFSGRDGKFPILVSEKKDGNKNIYRFKSNIALSEWKKEKEKIETALNFSILSIKVTKNKKVVELITVSSGVVMPTMLKWSDEFLHEQESVMKVGENQLGVVSYDINKTPHTLTAGTTGSGKSVVLRLLLRQMYLRGAEIYMFDFKGGVEFSLDYEEFGEVVIERERALEVLTLLVKENSERLSLFRNARVKNLKEYNDKKGTDFKRIGVFCDEIAEMLDKTGITKEEKKLVEEIEGKLSTLARLSRATGINLFLGTQRPDAKIITGQIKNNVDVRICGRFTDSSASEIVLGNGDATLLPDVRGRFVYRNGNKTVQVQAYYFDDDTMLKMVNKNDEVENVEDEITGEVETLNTEKQKVNNGEIKSKKNYKVNVNLEKTEGNKNISTEKNIKPIENNNVNSSGLDTNFDDIFENEKIS